MHNRIALLFGCLLIAVSSAFTQVSLSPYSHYGIGDIFNATSARSSSMGQIGIGMYDPANINRLNPASYADLRLTTFNLGGLATLSKQSSNYNSQVSGTAAFNNVAMGFSDRKGFGLVFGLAPYSALGYNIITRDSIMGDTSYLPYSQTYTASGGLSQLYGGFGLRFLRHFYGGLNLAFTFGTNSYNWQTDFDESTINTGAVDRRSVLSGLQADFGLQYGDTIRIRTETDRIKEIDKEIADLDGEFETLEKEKKSLEDDGVKLDRWESKKQKKLDDLTNQKQELDAQVQRLMVNERENRKEIGKLQDKAYRIEKKRKELARDIKGRRKESVDGIARVELQKERIRQKQEALRVEKKQIEAGHRKATSTKTKAYVLRLGATLDPGANLKGTRLTRYNNSVIGDTLINEEGKVSLPLKAGFGFTISQPNHWLIGADVSMQDWSTFSFFADPSVLKSALKINLGGEWTPELTSNKFAKKISYRLGGYFNSTNLNIAGQDIKELGVTAGVGIPIGYLNGLGPSYSRINLGMSLGRRGTLESNLLQEMTVQLRLGVNINDIWFIKRRID